MTITDASGTIVATAELMDGSTQDGAFRFYFSATGVPIGSSFYSVEISHRGKVTYPADKFSKYGDVALTLGNGTETATSGTVCTVEGAWRPRSSARTPPR